MNDGKVLWEEVKRKLSSLGQNFAFLDLNELIPTLIDTLKISRDRKFVFLLIGRTGVGKSSTVNSLMGMEVAKVGKYDPTTIDVERHENEINGVKFTVIDTPGLCDALPEDGNDQKYIELIQSKVDQIDCMWFVTRLDETRVSSDEIRGIKIITEAFNPEIWKRSIVVFTRADKADSYLEDLHQREKRVQEVIAKYTSTDIAESIPVVAVANGRETTPDGKQWLGELWTKVFIRIQDQGAIPYLMATVDRLNYGSKQSEPNWVWSGKSAQGTQFPKIEFNEELLKETRKRLLNVIPVLEKIGQVIGATAGRVVGGESGKSIGKEIGGALGGTVGKVIDFCLALF